MGNFIRTCGSSQFKMATGNAKCPIVPKYIKALILVAHGQKLPADITADEIEKACHADYPNRIYPLTHIAEYAPSGGEVQTAQVGYGPTIITGYSETADQFTLYDSDVQRRASIISNLNTEFDVYYVDDDNVIFGVEDDAAKTGEFPMRGFPLAGVGITGSKFKTSSSAATDVLTLYTRDYAQNESKFMAYPTDFALVSALEVSGIRIVEWVKMEDNKWKLVDKSTKSDVTNYYGDILKTKATTVFEGVTSVTYADGEITFVFSSGITTPKLKSPSVLQANGIVGIEQA